jgi:hypothetical protein
MTPVRKTSKRRSWRAGKRGALHGLNEKAVELIYAEQPLHWKVPAEDPLVIIRNLDNADKHQLLHPAFVYAGVDRGIDLIEVLDRGRLIHERNIWTAGQPLEDGTVLARFMFRGSGAREAIRLRPDAELGFASGPVGAPRTGYTDLIDRVRGVADKAVALIDGGF